MVGRRTGLRAKSISPITINTSSVIMKGRVADLLIPITTYFTMTPAITYFIFMNNIIHMARRTSYTKQSTIVTWVMGGRVSVLVPLSTSPITTNRISHIAIGGVSGLFKPIYISVIINSYTPPWVAIITTSISPPLTVIKTNITLLFFMNNFIYTTRSNWWIQ